MDTIILVCSPPCRSRCPLHGPPPQPAEPGGLVAMRSQSQRAALALAAILLSGCAMRQSPTALPLPPSPKAADATTAAPESLSEYMQKVRHLSANARPLNKNEAVETLEMRDPAIAAELLLVSSQPTAERYRSLAERYRERGVLDAAYRNFNRAIALNPRDGAAYEGLAGSGATGASQDSLSATRTAPSTTRHGRDPPGTPTARSCRHSASMTMRARPTRRQAGSSRRRRTPSTISAISRLSKGDSTPPSRPAGRHSRSTRR